MFCTVKQTKEQRETDSSNRRRCSEAAESTRSEQRTNLSQEGHDCVLNIKHADHIPALAHSRNLNPHANSAHGDIAPASHGQTTHMLGHAGAGRQLHRCSVPLRAASRVWPMAGWVQVNRTTGTRPEAARDPVSRNSVSPCQGRSKLRRWMCCAKQTVGSINSRCVVIRSVEPFQPTANSQQPTVARISCSVNGRNMFHPTCCNSASRIAKLLGSTCMREDTSIGASLRNARCPAIIRC